MNPGRYRKTRLEVGKEKDHDGKANQACGSLYIRVEAMRGTIAKCGLKRSDQEAWMPGDPGTAPQLLYQI
jgi:hypothetical protein